MTEPYVPAADALVERNLRYVAGFGLAGMDPAPALRLAVVACMDARMNVPAILGLEDGDAHVIRNAGGIVTDDVIRSLCLSQRSLGTREIVLVHHTRCGIEGLDEEGFLADLEADAGARPSWSLEAFADPYDDVRRSIRRLRASPFLPHTDGIRGFVYSVDDGRLDEVT
jgi:carbonic anhydrase